MSSASPASIAEFGTLLRRGEVSAECFTQTFLDRIAIHNGKLGAYTYVARDQALAAAQAIDRLLHAGTDLGPLMGVPVAIKDLFYVDGMPTTAGSRMDVADIVRAEGPFIRALKRCGCIILGKTWTSEFALGGINFVQRVPWNPSDANVHRTPGGSSGGSAVAMAAQLCAFAIGSDTGGSVRLPAALCGVVGHKFSSNAFSLEGIFPLSPTLDSIGSFTRSAGDAVLVWNALSGGRKIFPAQLDGVRLAKPRQHFYDELDHGVEQTVAQALERLCRAGATIVEMDLPEVAEFENVFSRIVPIELIAILGANRIEQNMDRLDPVVQSRFAAAPGLSATDYIDARRRQRALCEAVNARLRDYDAMVTATTPLLPGPLADFATLQAAVAWNRRALRNTRPGNVFDQCAVSLPLHDPATGLPCGLQLACTRRHTEKLLAIACTIEATLNSRE